MKLFSRLVLLLLVIYVGLYIMFRSAHIETYSKDNLNYVIYPAEDYIYKLFRPLAYVDEMLTSTGSHIGPFHDARTVFQETGVLERNNPGLKPGTWYLSYQSLGNPVLSIELSGVGTGVFIVGDRVSVTGTKQNDRVLVSRITKQKL